MANEPMNPLSQWAAIAGILSRGARSPAGLADYDAHVDKLLGAIDRLSIEASDELDAELAKETW